MGPINPMQPMLNTAQAPNIGMQGHVQGGPVAPMPLNAGGAINMPMPGPPLANPSPQGAPMGGAPYITPYPGGPNVPGPQAIVPPNLFQQNMVLVPNQILNVDYPDDYDDDDEEEEADMMAAMALQRRRMAPPLSQNGLVGPLIPQRGIRAGNPFGMVPAVPGPQMLPNAAYNPVDPELELPYSYTYTQSLIANYPDMATDLAILATVLQRIDGDLREYMTVLIDRSPVEVDALRREFRNMSRGTDLHMAFKNMLEARSETKSGQTAFMGLVLGPVLYDLWILQGVRPSLFFPR